MGKILKVDLSKGNSREINSKKYIPFIGGVGIAAKIFFNEVPFETGPFDPKNQLAFMTGPLTGTMIPGAGRGELCARSPTPYPKSAWTYSGFGGGWPAELKYAGYDGVIVEGSSDSPVYITIIDGECKIKNASDLWGLDTFETQKRISEKNDDPKMKSMVIGPAGENLVTQSVVLNETASVAGYGGMGAVMGSKKLKAVAVRGTGNIQIAIPEELLLLLRKIRKNFGFEGIWEYDNEPFAHGKDRYSRGNISNVEKKYFKFLDGGGVGAAAKGFHLRNSSCAGCLFACKGYFSYPGLPSGTAHCSQWWFASIRSPNDGGISTADADAWLANILANQLGLNIIENEMLAHWFKDCIEEGIITENDFPTPEFMGGSDSNTEFLRKFLNSIAYKKGFFKRFADGTMKGAESLGPKALQLYRKYITSRGIKRHHDTALAYLIWAMDSRDPFDSVHDDNAIFYKPENTRYHLGFNTTPWSYDTIPKVSVTLQHSKDLKNSLTLCDWCYPLISKDKKTGEFYGREVPAKLFLIVTGLNVDEFKLERYGERITNMMRAIMVSEKRTIEDDDVDELRYQTPLRKRSGQNETVILNKKSFYAARKDFYKIRGWNVETGRPTAEKLDELELHDVRIRLENFGLLP